MKTMLVSGLTIETVELPDEAPLKQWKVTVSHKDRVLKLVVCFSEAVALYLHHAFEKEFSF